MKENTLETMINELKAKVKQSSGQIREDEQIYLINLLARAEMELKKNGSGSPEILKNEILMFLRKP